MKLLTKKAELVARTAHLSINQKRKYTNEAYFVHCQNVAKIVRNVDHDYSMICAAYLHDTVEDTSLTIKFITEEFNNTVASLVYWLTNQSKPSDGNRYTRKKIDRHHISKAPKEAKTVKLADLIDNSCSIMKHDVGFSQIYLEEKRLLLDEALLEGDEKLWYIANEIIKNGLILNHEEVIEMIEE